MLVELDVSNFALIDSLRLRLHPGFNVLTGETGAGKSIIIDAVGALIGQRLPLEVIRSESDRALIDGQFSSLDGEAADWLEGEVFEDTSGEIVITRELTPRGGICRLNGRVIPLSSLQNIGRSLIHIHGQNDLEALFDRSEHREFLDRFAGAASLRSQLAELVRQYRSEEQELAALSSDEREKARLRDLLEFEVKEIGAAKLEVGEEEALRNELKILSNIERLAAASAAAYGALYEGSEGQSGAVELLSRASQAVTEISQIDANFSQVGEAVENALYQVEEAARTIRTYQDNLEFDPQRLNEVQERLDFIGRLKGKYGSSIADVLNYAEEAKEKLDSITHSHERAEKLQMEIETLKNKIGETAGKLSNLRRAAAEKLSARMVKELAELGMKAARFSVELRGVVTEDGVPFGGQSYAFDVTGIDQAEFLLSANPGEPLKPLAKVASGGESSRIMLALKTVLGDVDKPRTLIFDEIDAGLGGRSGQIVGEKLARLASKHQIICITHLAQIAALADAHFQVRKQVQKGRTVVILEELSGDARIEELAQMLAGKAAAGLFRQNAAELLRTAQEWKGNKVSF